MSHSNSYYVALSCLLFLLLISCRREEECADNAGIQQLELQYSGPWLILPGNQTQQALTLFHPEDCIERNPYRGDIQVRVLDPSIIPGYTIYVEGDFQRASDWTSTTQTPINGIRNIHLLAIPDTVDGSLAPTTPGDYIVDLEINFIPATNLVPTTVNRQINEEIEVRVTEQNLTIFIESPSREFQYDARPPNGGELYPLPVNATITNPNSELTEVAFRLDTLPWISITDINARELVLIDTAYLPPVWGGYHELTIRAESANGDTLSASSGFAIPFGNSNMPLNPHHWDGEGDGLNWHDPVNWEEDRLPGINDRAIVDLPGTELVLMQPDRYDSRDETYYAVGAISIDAKLIIYNSAVLRLYRAEPDNFEPTRSTINGPLAFQSPSYFGQAPRVELAAESGYHSLTLTDTVYISSAFFSVSDVAGQDAAFNVIVESFAIHEVIQGNYSSILKGRTLLDLQGTTSILPQFYWAFEENHGHSPTLRNSGEMHFAEGVEFASYRPETRASIDNRGLIHCRREAPDATLKFEGIDFIQTYGSRIIDTMGLGFGPLSGVHLENCSGNVSGIRVKGEIKLLHGDLALSNCQARGVQMTGTNTDYAVLRIHNDSRSLGTITANFGIISNNLDGFYRSAQLQKVLLNTGSIMQIEDPNSILYRSVDIDSLILWGGAVTIDAYDSLKLGYLQWRSGSILGAQTSRTVIRPQSAGAVSRILLGPNEGVFTGSLNILEGAQLNFETGHIKGIDEERVYVTIHENGIFRFVNALGNTSWNLPEGGQHQGWVYMLNFGTIEKTGSQTAQVQGCRYPHTNGILDIQDGILQFVRQNNPSWTCN
ncbi:MAG: hypothetical protein AAFV07_02455 [Bacteroidota bacterium]